MAIYIDVHFYSYAHPHHSPFIPPPPKAKRFRFVSPSCVCPSSNVVCIIPSCILIHTPIHAIPPSPHPTMWKVQSWRRKNGGRRVGVRAEAGPSGCVGRAGGPRGAVEPGRRNGLEGCAVPERWEQDLCWPPARTGPGPRSGAVPEGRCRRTGPGRRTGPRSRAGGPGRCRAGGPGRCRAGGPDDKKCILCVYGVDY